MADSKACFRAFVFISSVENGFSVGLSNNHISDPGLYKINRLRRQMKRAIRSRWGSAAAMKQAAQALGYEFTLWRHFKPAGASVSFSGKRPTVRGGDFPQLARWLLGDDSLAEIYPLDRPQFISDARELARSWAEDERTRLAIDARYGALCKFLGQEF